MSWMEAPKHAELEGLPPPTIYSGTVSSWNPHRGVGRIKPDSDEIDHEVIVDHQSFAGARELEVGESVSFETVPGPIDPDRFHARNVKVPIGGTVRKWITSQSRGMFGFITPDDGSEDIFVHNSAFKGKSLKEGKKVTYVIVPDRDHKIKAACVQGEGVSDEAAPMVSEPLPPAPGSRPPRRDDRRDDRGYGRRRSYDRYDDRRRRDSRDYDRRRRDDSRDYDRRRRDYSYDRRDRRRDYSGDRDRRRRRDDSYDGGGGGGGGGSDPLGRG